MTSRYLQRGVSSQKEDVHKAIASLSKGLFPGAFCRILPDYLSGSRSHCLIMHADGAGTKAALAYIYWKETGDYSVWKGIAQDALVMNTDDLLCAGATGPMLFSSSIARNKKLIDGRVLETLIQATQSLVRQFKQYGLELIPTGGETADVGDLVRTIVVDATMMCRMKRKHVIDNRCIQPGDIIIGLASFGKTTYEKEYNSGIGSNGLTSARHDLLHAVLKKKYPESFDPTLPSHLVYAGSRHLLDHITIEHQGKQYKTTIGKLLLSPTRTYAPVLLEILKQHRSHIHGMIHCTGGGQTKILHFINRLHVIKDNLFDVPPIFRMIQQESATDWKEMYSVFNMGHRMEIYTSSRYANAILAICRQFNLEARIIGRVEKGKTKKLTLITEKGIFEYGN
jgi:phosphoribosylformylglycinamidine cyclo-ligase